MMQTKSQEQLGANAAAARRYRARRRADGWKFFSAWVPAALVPEIRALVDERLDLEHVRPLAPADDPVSHLRPKRRR